MEKCKLGFTANDSLIQDVVALTGSLEVYSGLVNGFYCLIRIIVPD